MKLSKMHKRLLALSAMLPMGAAMAQEAPAAAPAAATPVINAPQLETVTVTAQRRTENIRDVPVSVSLLKDENLDVINSGGGDIRELAARVPSLNIESSNGRTFPRFYIRGYGNTDFSTFASQPVSLIYDDIVQENPILKGFPIFDLADVEVLNGPQGTLFGRNTPAGVVKFESEKPKLGKTEGYYSLSTATHGTDNAEGAINVPLSTEWAMRFSMLREHRDNYVNNSYTGQQDAYEGYNEEASRVQFLYKPNAAFEALFNVHSRETTGSARLFRGNLIQKGTNDFAPGFNYDSISTDGLNMQNLSTNGANMHLSWDLGSVKLYSITGYEGVDGYYSRGDIDGGTIATSATSAGANHTPFPVQTGGGLSGLTQYTQEFRAESHYDTPLNWQAGLYYFSENANGFSNNYDSVTELQTSHLASHQKNTAEAVFGSLSYAATDALTLRGGLRYTDDKKEFNTVQAINVVQVGPKSVEESKSKVNWDVSADYKLDKDTSVYSRIATGFRAPSIAAASSSVPITVANAETITSYEAGIKADLWNRRARASFSIYDYTVKNQQLTVVGGTSNVTQLINAAKTLGHGAEGNFEAFVTPDFKVTVGGSYNFTKIDDPSLSVAKCNGCTITNPLTAAGNPLINGNPLPQAPKWIGNFTARYNIPTANGNFFVLTDWAYRSEVNFFLYEAKEYVGKALLEGGLRAGYNWDEGKYEVAVFGRNITNTQRITGAIDFDNLTGFVNDPRQVGVQFKGSF